MVGGCDVADHEQNKIVNIDGYFTKQYFCPATVSLRSKKTGSSRAAPTYIINDAYGFNKELIKNLIEFGIAANLITSTKFNSLQPEIDVSLLLLLR